MLLVLVALGIVAGHAADNQVVPVIRAASGAWDDMIHCGLPGMVLVLLVVPMDDAEGCKPAVVALQLAILVLHMVQEVVGVHHNRPAIPVLRRVAPRHALVLAVVAAHLCAPRVFQSLGKWLARIAQTMCDPILCGVNDHSQDWRRLWPL